MSSIYMNNLSRLMSRKLLPTGVPLDTVSTPSNPLFYVGNLLTVYGYPNAMRVTHMLKDYVMTYSLYSFFELVKLTTKFGVSYCVSTLAISLGRDISKEIESLSLIYPYINLDTIGAPALSTIPVFHKDTDRVLTQVFDWFGYDNLDAVLVLRDPQLFINWLVTQEARYAEPFGSLVIDPTLFIQFLLSQLNMPMTTELSKYIKEAF